MNIQSSIHKIEASLWETMISLMSNSSTVQRVIRKSFILVKDNEVFWLAGLIIAWTAAGLTVGYFLGFQGMR